MNTNIPQKLGFKLNIYSISLFFIGIAALLLGLTTYAKEPKNRLNQIFFLYCLFAAYISLISHELVEANTISEAYFWIKACFIWPLIVSFLVHFILLYTERTALIEKKLIIGSIYIPPSIISILWLFSDVISGIPLKEYWGWTILPPYPLLQLIIIVPWISSISLWALILSFKYYRKISEPIKRNQAKFVFIGITIPIIAILVIDTLLQNILPLNYPSSYLVSFGVGSFAISYAILRYNLFQLNPVTMAENILSTITDTLFIVGPAGKILFVNQATTSLLGYSENELVGAYMKSFFDSDNPKTLINWESLFVTKIKRKKGFEMKIINRGGKIIDISVSASIIRREDGTLQGIVCTGRDISSIKQAQAIRRELEHRRSDFISMTTHELRTPLTSIAGYSEFLLQHYENLDSGRVELALESINRNVKRLDRLVRGTTDIIRTEKKLFDLETKNIDFRSFLKQSISDYQSILGPQLKFQDLSEGESPINIDGDPERLGQVFDNVLDNAKKNTSNLDREINISLEVVSERVKVSITDNGAGIAPEHHDRIFEQFLSIPTQYSARGSGIGLYLSRMIIKAHRGKLSVASKGKGYGATFIIELPIMIKN